MTQLRPTPSRRVWGRIPRWALVATITVLGLALIGAGLVLSRSGGSTKAATPTPTCTPTPAPGATTPPTTAIRINVYNATARAGLARFTADKLAGRGFTIDTVANDPTQSTVNGTAIVRYVSGTASPARWVAAQVPNATLVKVSGVARLTTAKIDLVIGTKYRNLAPPADAAAAYAASAPTKPC